MSDTRNVPPEITADQLFGVRPADEMYECDLCGRQFCTYEGFLDHYMAGCDDPDPTDEPGGER